MPEATSTQFALRLPPPESATRRPAPSTCERHRALHAEQLGAEAARLIGAAPREVRAAEAAGEPEVVLDAAGLPGLAAGRLALDHHRAQALGRAVDGGRQPGGPPPTMTRS